MQVSRSWQLYECIAVHKAFGTSTRSLWPIMMCTTHIMPCTKEIAVILANSRLNDISSTSLQSEWPHLALVVVVVVLDLRHGLLGNSCLQAVPVPPINLHVSLNHAS